MYSLLLSLCILRTFMRNKGLKMCYSFYFLYGMLLIKKCLELPSHKGLPNQENLQAEDLGPNRSTSIHFCLTKRTTYVLQVGP